MIESIFDPRNAPDETTADRSLRPRILSEFVGQKQVVGNLKVYLEAARRRGEALDHVLLSGLPGLGKTTLAHLIATEMGVECRSTSGPAVERPGDLAGILTNLGPGEVLFIDEIHRLTSVVEEVLYGAMEDCRLDIVIDQGPSARSVRLDLPPFTLVGATTREGLLTAPLRARFGIHERLTPYPTEELTAIVKRSADVLDVGISDAGARALAERSRGTPRVANRFLRRIRDLACVRETPEIDEPMALEGLEMLGVDRHGLCRLDRQILKAVIRHGGRPVGLKTIATIVGEQSSTLEDVYEPYLIQKGYLQKTPRGRLASEAAFRLMEDDLSVPLQGELWNG